MAEFSTRGWPDLEIRASRIPWILGFPWGLVQGICLEFGALAFGISLGFGSWNLGFVQAQEFWRLKSWIYEFRL